ncbi:MAG: ribosome small subunit-dependent GTPase A [Spirochaetes bacterium]|nr:ribosome small subunit-dependent GTPase A [Spirochaetota bacterium]
MDRQNFNLLDLGFNNFFEKQINENTAYADLLPGRVSTENHNIYSVLSENGLLSATLTGKLNNQIRLQEIEKPVAGDWVIMQKKDNDSAVIAGILSRFSSLYRNTPGKKTEKQLLVANINFVFIVSGLDHDLNLRRTERYITMVWESGAFPVILLNKADLIDSHQFEDLQYRIEQANPGVPVFMISALQNFGIDQLKDYLKPGKTIALMGSSGSGKSTLLNSLLGKNIQLVNKVRESDSRGRHTTVIREMFILDCGSIVIDNPGLREIQLYADNNALDRTFKDISNLAADCRFKNCTHVTEPGCAVQKALLDGDLDPDRYSSYLKLQREIDFLENRIINKKSLKEKNISKFAKAIKKHGKPIVQP